MTSDHNSNDIFARSRGLDFKAEGNKPFVNMIIGKSVDDIDDDEIEDAVGSVIYRFERMILKVKYFRSFEIFNKVLLKSKPSSKSQVIVRFFHRTLSFTSAK